MLAKFGSVTRVKAANEMHPSGVTHFGREHDCLQSAHRVWPPLPSSSPHKQVQPDEQRGEGYLYREGEGEGEVREGVCVHR